MDEIDVLRKELKKEKCHSKLLILFTSVVLIFCPVALVLMGADCQRREQEAENRLQDANKYFDQAIEEERQFYERIWPKPGEPPYLLIDPITKKPYRRGPGNPSAK